MHELSICQALIEVATDALRRVPAPAPRVRCVDVRIGRLAAVVPELLRFHFDLLVAGTPLDGATLVIEEVPARGRCEICLHAFDVDQVPTSCPACGAWEVAVTGGQELDLVSLEVDDDTRR